MTKRPDLPDLGATGRRYVENTGRARLASPGIERFEARRGSGRRVGGALTAIALLALVAALVAAMLSLR